MSKEHRREKGADEFEFGLDLILDGLERLRDMVWCRFGAAREKGGGTSESSCL
jgi:hypothetical protein